MDKEKAQWIMQDTKPSAVRLSGSIDVKAADLRIPVLPCAIDAARPDEYNHYYPGKVKVSGSLNFK